MDHERRQRLVCAAKAGDVDALYKLIGEDPNILEDDIMVDGTDLVDYASTAHKFQQHIAFAVEILILKPSLAKKPNKVGDSPIHVASSHGNVQLVRELLEIDSKFCLLPDKFGYTPLHNAAIGGHSDVITTLLKCCPESIEKLTSHDETALHLAARHLKLSACTMLVRWLQQHKKLDLLNSKKRGGRTAPEDAELMHEYLWKKRQLKKMNYDYAAVNRKRLTKESQMTKMKILIQEFFYVCEFGETPIHIASLRGDTKLVWKLLKIDSKLCLLTDDRGRIPLHCAAEGGHTRVINELLRWCHDSIEKLTVDEETAIHLAVKCNNLQACKVLVEELKRYKRLDLLNSKDKWGMTALQVSRMFPERYEFKELQELLGLIMPPKNSTQDFILSDKEPRSGDKVLISQLPPTKNALHEFFFPDKEPMTSDMCRPLLVFALLILTVTLAAVINPPRLILQNHTTKVEAIFAEHKAIMRVFPFIVLTSLGFLASLRMIVILTSHLFQCEIQMELFLLSILAYSLILLSNFPMTSMIFMIVGMSCKKIPDSMWFYIEANYYSKIEKYVTMSVAVGLAMTVTAILITVLVHLVISGIWSLGSEITN